jgi:hypothetical protein
VKQGGEEERSLRPALLFRTPPLLASCFLSTASFDAR